DLAVRIDAPQLSGLVLPVGIAGEEGALGVDGQVIGLVHAGLVGQHGNLLGFRVDLQDIVPSVVRHVHHAGAIEANPVPGAAFGQGDKDLALPVGADLADV